MVTDLRGGDRPRTVAVQVCPCAAARRGGTFTCVMWGDFGRGRENRQRRIDSLGGGRSVGQAPSQSVPVHLQPALGKLPRVMVKRGSCLVDFTGCERFFCCPDQDLFNLFRAGRLQCIRSRPTRGRGKRHRGSGARRPPLRHRSGGDGERHSREARRGGGPRSGARAHLWVGHLPSVRNGGADDQPSYVGRRDSGRRGGGRRVTMQERPDERSAPRARHCCLRQATKPARNVYQPAR
jgi:hypothetical protein